MVNGDEEVEKDCETVLRKFLSDEERGEAMAEWADYSVRDGEWADPAIWAAAKKFVQHTCNRAGHGSFGR